MAPPGVGPLFGEEGFLPGAIEPPGDYQPVFPGCHHEHPGLGRSRVVVERARVVEEGRVEPARPEGVLETRDTVNGLRDGISSQCLDK